jgi:hypothetical protein
VAGKVKVAIVVHADDAVREEGETVMGDFMDLNSGEQSPACRRRHTATFDGAGDRCGGPPQRRRRVGSVVKRDEAAVTAPRGGRALPVARVWQRRWDQRREAVAADDCAAVDLCDELDQSAAAAVRDSFRGGETAALIDSVFWHFVRAQPTVAPEFASDFVADKLKVLYGRDSVFWRGTLSKWRVIRSPVELEEIVSAVASIAFCSAAGLCHRFIAALSDTDIFMASLTLTELLSAFDDDIDDVVEAFDMHAVASPDGGGAVMLLAGWVEFNTHWVDVCYSASLVENVFHRAAVRSAGPVDARRLHLTVETFCIAIAMVIPFKIPSPFVPLEQKVRPFVRTWVVIGSSKVKAANVLAKAALHM